MLNTKDKVIEHKVGLLDLTEEPNNLSVAFQVMCLSRDYFGIANLPLNTVA